MITVSFWPHIKDKISVQKIMLYVIIALLPATCASIYFFRLSAVKLIFVSCFCAVAAEAAIKKLRKQPISIRDLSALVTGLLFALILPPGIPLWQAALGVIFAVSVAKEVFGGLGYNIFNPALAGRAFLMAAFPVFMTTWIEPFSLDAVTSATPLSLAKFNNQFVPISNLFFGNISGSLGETSALALLIGGIFLIIKKCIDWRVPFGIFASVILIATIARLIDPVKFASPAFHLLSGGLMLGAIFMATDPVTSPVTKKGRWIFGVAIGILVMIIRLWGGLPEGVMYSILIMNAFVPLINRYIRPRLYGAVKK